jgi:hypothetical protein
VAGRDKDATWCTTGELGWPKPKLIYKLQQGMTYRTWPPGHTLDWHDPAVEHSLNVEASTVTLVTVAPPEAGVVGLCALPLGIEVLPPIDAEMPSLPADALPSVRWAIAMTRNLRAENKIPEGTRKADLARLLEAEAQKAVKAGQLEHALKASYLENQLAAWGIWPLNSLE